MKNRDSKSLKVIGCCCHTDTVIIITLKKCRLLNLTGLMENKSIRIVILVTVLLVLVMLVTDFTRPQIQAFVYLHTGVHRMQQ